VDVEDYKRSNYTGTRSPVGQDSAVESGVNSAENSVDNGSESCNQPSSFRSSAERLGGSGDFRLSELDIEMKTLNLQSNLSQSDSNIYQSSRQSGMVSKDEILQSLQKHSSRSSLECQDSRSGSPSTQSTSTSAEFSLGNVNSYCDQIEDSEVTGLIEDTEVAGAATSKRLYDFSKDNDELNKCIPIEAGAGEPVEHLVLQSDSLPMAALPKTMNSPADEDESAFKGGSDFIPCSENWDEPCSNVATGSTVSFDSLSVSSVNEEPEPSRRYFKAEWGSNNEDNTRTLSVMVDKRITLGAFKHELAQYVGVPANNFKVSTCHCRMLIF